MIKGDHTIKYATFMCNYLLIMSKRGVINTKVDCGLKNYKEGDGRAFN